MRPAAARNFTHADLSENDVVFTMKSQEQTNSIDGPSAGALMCILLVSVIDGRSLDSNVTVTGTIETDALSGRRGLLEKAEAAHAAGKTLSSSPEANKDAVFVRGSGLYGNGNRLIPKRI
jgi:predicted S18 family serine protease